MVLVIGTLYGTHGLVLDMMQSFFAHDFFKSLNTFYLFIAYDWDMKSWLGLGVWVAWDLCVENVGKKDSNPFLSVTNSYSPHIDFFLTKGEL